MPKQETMEAIEETLEAVERIPKVQLNGTTKKQQVIILGVTALVGALAGGGVSYYFTKKHFALKYEALAEEEIEQARQFYQAMNTKPDPEALLREKHPTSSLDKAVTGLEEYTSDAAKDAVEEARPERDTVTHQLSGATTAKKEHNIFTNSVPTSTDGWDQVVEESTRTETEPYIISHDEFYEGAKDYTQSQLSYWGEDDVLADDKEKPIIETDSVVGDDNLTKFGHGSKDANIVYVRNDRLEIDFEIVRSDGSYKRDVLGFLEHSQRPGKRQRRGFDDE